MTNDSNQLESQVVSPQMLNTRKLNQQPCHRLVSLTPNWLHGRRRQQQQLQLRPLRSTVSTDNDGINTTTTTTTTTNNNNNNNDVMVCSM